MYTNLPFSQNIHDLAVKASLDLPGLRGLPQTNATFLVLFGASRSWHLIRLL